MKASAIVTVMVTVAVGFSALYVAGGQLKEALPDEYLPISAKTYDSDRITTLEEIQLAGEIAKGALKMSVEEALDSNQLRMYQNIREQEDYKMKGQAVPRSLYDEKAILESKKRRLERRLKELTP